MEVISRRRNGQGGEEALKHNVDSNLLLPAIAKTLLLLSFHFDDIMSCKGGTLKQTVAYLLASLCFTQMYLFIRPDARINN